MELRSITAKTRHRNRRAAMRYIRPGAEAVAEGAADDATAQIPDPDNIETPAGLALAAATALADLMIPGRLTARRRPLNRRVPSPGGAARRGRAPRRSPR